MNMRAKMRVSNVVLVSETQENLSLTAVAKSESYPEDGSDENNTYAKFTPSGSVELTIQNPALLGKFTVGDEYYLDFTKVESAAKQEEKTEEKTEE